MFAILNEKLDILNENQMLEILILQSFCTKNSQLCQKIKGYKVYFQRFQRLFKLFKCLKRLENAVKRSTGSLGIDVGKYLWIYLTKRRLKTISYI